MKPKKTGEYRDLQLMPGRDDLWQFDVKIGPDKWRTLTNMWGESEEARKEFAQKTANDWKEK